MSPILVTLTSRSNSDFERSNVSLKENKPDGVNPNSNDIDCYVRKKKEKFYRFRQTFFTRCRLQVNLVSSKLPFFLIDEYVMMSHCQGNAKIGV